jgi:hypothetical protein
MIRTPLALAALLTATAAHAQAPCGLLTDDQIKAVLSSPVNPGSPGGSKDAPDCTWRDTKGQDRVYLSLRDSKDWHATRDSMQSTGRMVPITGLAEDAFFVSSTGTGTVLYALKHAHALLITVTGLNFDKGQNEAAEKALATQIIAKL